MNEWTNEPVWHDKKEDDNQRMHAKHNTSTYLHDLENKVLRKHPNKWFEDVPNKFNVFYSLIVLGFTIKKRKEMKGESLYKDGLIGVNKRYRSNWSKR